MEALERLLIDMASGDLDARLTEAKFTERARRVLSHAQEEARRLDHHSIGTEHLLLGLLREGEGIASGVIERLGVSQETVRIHTMQIITQTAPRHSLQQPPPAAVEDDAATRDAN